MTHTSSLLLLLLSYLFGALPIGLLVGRMVKGIDVRDYGSGNIGASNVWRTMGPLWGVAVFLFDFCKGYFPTFAAAHAGHHAHLTPWLPVGTGLAAILGHNFSPFLKFKGGKGVATSLGVVYGLSPEAAVIGFAAWGLCLLATRYISISSMLGAVVTSGVLIFLHPDPPHVLFCLLMTAFVFFKHRSNVARVRAGTEPKVGRSRKSVEPSLTPGPSTPQ